MQKEKTEVQVIFICLKEVKSLVKEKSKYRMETSDVRQKDKSYESVIEEAYQFLKEYQVARNHKDLLMRSVFR